MFLLTEKSWGRWSAAAKELHGIQVLFYTGILYVLWPSMASWAEAIMSALVSKEEGEKKVVLSFISKVSSSLQSLTIISHGPTIGCLAITDLRGKGDTLLFLRNFRLVHKEERNLVYVIILHYGNFPLIKSQDSSLHLSVLGSSYYCLEGQS